MEQTRALKSLLAGIRYWQNRRNSLMITTVELLTEAVNVLVLQVFRKDDYAVKYAVEPLLDGDGAAERSSVRLKLSIAGRTQPHRI